MLFEVEHNLINKRCNLPWAMKYKQMDWYNASAMFIQKLYGLYTVLILIEIYIKYVKIFQYNKGYKIGCLVRK